MKKALIVLLGPTAVGKTKISIELAQRVDGEIVSADSRLFYRGMDIGTAKPSLEERKIVPHHLINILDPDEEMSLAQFQGLAHEAIEQIHQRGNIPILVGGSGQYVRAITHGWLPPEIEASPALRQALEQWGDEIGVETLHAKLKIVDPVAASKMDKRNMRRIVRAFEVLLISGKRISDHSRNAPIPYELFQVGLIRNREILYQRVDERLEQMMEMGWLEEVEELQNKGYDPELPSMSAIGYAQLAELSKGKIEMEEAIVQIRKKSRAFVRRQANWFKANDPDIHWLNLDEGDQIESINAAISDFLDRNQAGKPRDYD